MAVIARRRAVSWVSSPMVSSAEVMGMPARTNTASWRVKCISSFFFTFSLVISNCSSPRFSASLVG